MSVSDNTSCMEAPRSPFLQFKSEALEHQKAGTPFEFIEPVTFGCTNIAKMDPNENNNNDTENKEN